MRFVSTFNVHLALSSKEELCWFVQLITTSSVFVSILITTVAKKLKSSVLCVCQGIRFWPELPISGTNRHTRKHYQTERRVQIEKFYVIKQLAIFNGSICADFDGDEHDRDVIRKKQQ